MAFDLGDVKVAETKISPADKPTVERDRFVELLLKNGFIADKSGTPKFDYDLFKYRINDWLYVRVYRNEYAIHLFSNSDMYVVKRKAYDVRSQSEERFMLNNILATIV